MAGRARKAPSWEHCCPWTSPVALFLPVSLWSGELTQHTLRAVADSPDQGLHFPGNKWLSDLKKSAMESSGPTQVLAGDMERSCDESHVPFVSRLSVCALFRRSPLDVPFL
jgi:hypothetical protein